MGEGPFTLIFIHGWAGDHTHWEHQVNHFSQNYRVIAIDLGGHGESGTSREQWSMKNYGEDIKSIVEELSLENVILIGHSMGGAAAVEAARLLENKIIGIIVSKPLCDVCRVIPGETDFS